MKCAVIIIISFSLFIQKMAYCDFFTNDNPSNFSKYTVVPKIKREPKKKEIKKKKEVITVYKFNHNSKYIPYKAKKIIPSSNGNKVSFEKFREILLVHNFPSDAVERMWCIAHHESGFNPLAYNYNKNRSFDVGLFQINQIWKKWCGMKDRDLLDVSNNTKCALVVLKKQGFTAWVTYKKFCRGV